MGCRKVVRLLRFGVWYNLYKGGEAMTNYEKAVALWQAKRIITDAELAEALNGHSIAFAYHSNKCRTVVIRTLLFDSGRFVLTKNAFVMPFFGCF